MGRLLPLALALALAPGGPAAADTLVAARTIRAQSQVLPGDITVLPGDGPADALARPEAALGLEARVTIYAGRPLRAADLGPPALVERNQIVTLVFRRGPLTIQAEGRALGRAAAGDRLRAMNLASRSTIDGTVRPDGTVLVTAH